MDFKYFASLLLVLTCLDLAAIVTSSPPLQLEPQLGFDTPDYDLSAQLSKFNTPRFRLPRSVIPLHYNLDIIPVLYYHPDLDFTAPGTVRILVNCVESTANIVLHSHAEHIIEQGDIQVTKSSDNTVIPVSAHHFTEGDQSLTIELESALTVGEDYTIAIKFISLINEGQDGLYRSSYTDADGTTTKWIATTQFEAIGARRAFPCFDEPALRATFDIRIGRNTANTYHTLCNTARVNIAEPIGPEYGEWPGWVWDEYETTPNMPTYLIAIIVSDFGFQLAETGLYRHPVSTWAPRHQLGGDAGVYSADIQAKLLTFFETYFDSQYQLNKMDSVAIEIFAAGAMENWGLNTYRVALMLFVQGESTQFEKWRQAAVISHELSHQWFGNLFTINWWNDLWLKEGFARYLQFIGVEGADTEMEAMNRVVLDCIQIAMANDILPASHPLHQPITDVMPSSNSRIIYEKGASLIRMMQGFLTEETLIAALRKYLVEFSYSSATQAQLFEILTEQSHADGSLDGAVSVWDIMESWTERTGFPLIRVSKAGETRVFISQEKFYANSIPSATHDVEPDYLWEVPITYATAANPDFTSANWRPKFWLHKETVLTSFTVDTTSEWIIMNPDARSYYRVLYDAELFGLIKGQLERDHTVISLSSRSQLLDDYFASAYNNYIGIRSALELTTYMHGESELVPWTTLVNHLTKPYALLSDTDVYDEFKTYVLSKVTPQLDALQLIPVPGETPVPAMFRAQLLDWACSIDPTYCSAASLELVNLWITGPDNPITADTQAVFYCAAVSNGDATIVEFIRDRYKDAATSVRQKGLLLNALACHSTVALLQETLDSTLAVDAEFIIKDRITLIQKVAANTMGRDIAFEFLTTRKQDIIDMLGATAISSVISTLSTYFSTGDRVTQIQEFISSNTDLPADVITELNRSLATVETNKAWVDVHLGGIREFLATVKKS